ncbi:hypothetical protein SEA_DMPSTRDIVER_70 [Mycobacterium phage DmpstrDiver]|nr:hypothetical protein SEA_DMPSTRDIVER_70 [Mycobacterium phage DmpstrDiver]AWH14057.1 hypothetical protein SEA_HALLEY_72 [Mycobacterium phage Halley]QDM58055.1 hypothetical protein SEA_NIHILNOMEN_71 [Mycobacterium phage NihilNomen]
MTCLCNPEHGKLCGCGKRLCAPCCYAAHETCPCSCPGCSPEGWSGAPPYPHICGKEDS